MSNDYNRCTFTGRLGADPESRKMPSGDSIVSFSVASGKTWKDKTSGERKELTEWVRCVAFGKLADICTQYLKKGAQVLVDGEMRTRKYTDKSNVERWSTEIVLNQMKMLGTKPEGTAAAPAAQKPAAAANSPGPEHFDDDIPF